MSMTIELAINQLERLSGKNYAISGYEVQELRPALDLAVTALREKAELEDTPIKMVIPECIDEQALMEMIHNAPVQILPCEPVQEWISVKDRLPIEEAKAHEQEWCEEYCEFLVMIERGLLPTTLHYDWENNEWFRINTAFERETYKVTHWMEMPQPPKGE